MILQRPLYKFSCDCCHSNEGSWVDLGESERHLCRKCHMFFALWREEERENRGIFARILMAIFNI